MPDLTPLADLGAVARTVAALGAAEVRRHAPTVTSIATKSSDTDPVTSADRASHEAIRAELTARRPGDGLLSEEEDERRGSSGLRWVIDPLDGTVNLTYGIQHCCVSVSCERETADGWRPVAAAVHDVFRSDEFTAVAGGGAALNGRPIQVRGPGPVATALVAVGFAYTAASRYRQSALARELLRGVGDLRVSGSSALDLCWVACGLLDGFAEDELGRWDWSAGVLLIEEAGGTTTPYGSGVIAGRPLVHDWLSTQARRLVDR